MNEELLADILSSDIQSSYNFFNDLIDFAVFPIVATDMAGIILYKNKAAARYLPMLRRGAAVHRHIVTSLDEGTLLLRYDSLYSRAVVLRGNRGYHLVFFSRIQYVDGEEAANEIAARYSGEPISLFMDFLRMRFTTSKADCSPVARTDAELIRLFGTHDLHENMRSFTPYALMQYLSSKLSGAFRSLGYRFIIKIDDSLRDFRGDYRVLTDFLFLFGRMLYAVMKLSSSGHVQIIATMDNRLQEVPVLHYTTDTVISPREAVGVDAIKQFSTLIPECVVEFAVLNRVPVFRDGVALSVDERGHLYVRQQIPLVRVNELSISAISADDPYLSDFSHLLVEQIRSSLRRIMMQ